jgi:hypothetical protein
MNLKINENDLAVLVILPRHRAKRIEETLRHHRMTPPPGS